MPFGLPPTSVVDLEAPSQIKQNSLIAATGVITPVHYARAPV